MEIPGAWVRLYSDIPCLSSLMFKFFMWGIEPALSLLYVPSTGKGRERLLLLLKPSSCFVFNVNSVFRNVLPVADLTSQPNSLK